MFELGPIDLGIAIFLLGLGIITLTLVILRFASKPQTTSSITSKHLPNLEIEPHKEAILLVHHGGRISYINQQARELFGITEDRPDLESLARRTHPTDVFLKLCASEGKARFSLNGRFIDGTSYFAPSDAKTSQANYMLVTLRRHELIINYNSPPKSDQSQDDLQRSPSDISPHAISFITELNQSMASSLDLEETLQAILESVEQLLPSDFLEITIWEKEYQRLKPFRLIGLPGVDRRLEKVKDYYRSDEGYSGYLASNRTPLLIKDVNTFRETRPSLDRQRYPFQSYLGIPLLLAGELIGTLELASLENERYKESDLELLQLLSSQATIALSHALLNKQEQKQSLEISGLADLAKSVSTILDPQDLYSQLVENISKLVPVEILGFLTYDENHRILKGQEPFIGILPSIIEWYQTAIQPGSPAEEIWKSAATISSSYAPEDSRIKALELHHIAQAAGIHQTVFTPLSSSGNMLGYIQAANKHDGTAFDQTDLRFLKIIAGQVAPIIENATLVQNARQRAQRAETLRRIASLTSSTATLDEILKYSILDLARLLKADMAAIYLLNEDRGELRLHKDSTFGISPEIIQQLSIIPTDNPRYQQTITYKLKEFISNDLSEDQEIHPIYKSFFGELEARSLMVVPLSIRDHGIGEISVASLHQNSFSPLDIQTTLTAAVQLASAIEQSTVHAQTDQDLRQRVEQLTSLTRVSRELNTTLELTNLVERVYDEIIRATEADCGTLMLFEQDASNSSQSEEISITNPKILLHIGEDPGTELHPLEAAVLRDGKTLIIDDFPNSVPISNVDLNKDSTHLKEPSSEQLIPTDLQNLYPAHHNIRSAIVSPIAYQGQVAGIIHLHAQKTNHFKETDREIIEALAVQTAIAISNIKRYQEQFNRSTLLNQRVETLSNLFEISKALQSDQSLEKLLTSVAAAIQSATPFEKVIISLFDPESQNLGNITAAGISLSELDELRKTPRHWVEIQELSNPDFQRGNLYFITSEDNPLNNKISLEQTEFESSQNWQPGDILIVPLFNAGNSPLGVISVDAPRDNLRPNQQTIDTLELFSNQVSLIIESKQRVHNLRSQVEHFQSELDLAYEAAQDARNHLPSLLHKDLEQTLSIQQLSQQTRRINAGLEIAQEVSQQSNRMQAFEKLGQETLARMDYDIVLIAEPTRDGLNLVFTMGSIPEKINPKALLGQRNPLRRCIQSSELLFVSSVNEDLDWQGTPLLRAMETKSFLCLPIREMINGHSLIQNEEAADQLSTDHQKPIAAMLAISQSQLPSFTNDDAQIYNLLSHQVAATLKNLNLLTETTHRLKEVNLLLDFSRQLGSLDPANILHSLVENALQAVPAARGAMVAMWDAQSELLVPQTASGYSDDGEMLKVHYKTGEGLPGQIFDQKRAMILGEVNFTRHYNLSQENFIQYRNATGGEFPVSSIGVPIMTGTVQLGEEGNPSLIDFQNIGKELQDDSRTIPLGVIVLDNDQVTGAFTQEDLTVIASLAQQTALSLENARLYQSSEHRSDQLEALTGISTTISSSLRAEELIATLLDQLQEILPYDTGTLWLRQKQISTGIRQSSIDQMTIQAARGFEDSDTRVGLEIDIQDSQLLNEMINTGKPIWVPNVSKDDRFRGLSLDEEWAEELKDTFEDDLSLGFEHLSWLGIPLISSGEVTGVIALEKTEPNFYSLDDIQVAATFAGQAAIGLENADLYQESVNRAAELAQRTQTLSILNRLSSDLSSSLEVKHILDIATRELFQIMPCTFVSALWFDYKIGEEESPQLKSVILQAEHSKNIIEKDSAFKTGNSLPIPKLFMRLQETKGIFNTDDISLEPDIDSLREFLDQRNTHSLLIVPIISGGTSENDAMPEHHFHGVLLIHNDQSYRFAADEVELARTISNQVALTLQNARLFEETRSLTEDLEIRVEERTAELGREHRRAETLLRIITELSASLDLDQVLHSTLQVLSEFVDAEQITILIARPGEKKLQRLASIGYTTDPEEEGSPTPFDSDEGLAGWIIKQRKAVLVDNVLKDDRWIKVPYSKDESRSIIQHRSAMGVPLMSGAEALGCLLLFHPQETHFSLDQLDLVQAAANQVSVAVNNAELYRLIRDQAEDLGTMLRSQQIETSRSMAILEAVADGVLVTDSNSQITLFNASAEKILGLERSQVLSKSMELFSGLFGRATSSWLDTIKSWSKDPSTYQSGDTYAEKFTLEDGRVISVHLAPVISGNDFLGTVSIFQDITHQVEVDRLKSEFVATVSHELRTPMTSIKGYVEILLMGAAGQLSSRQNNFLKVVQANTERLSILVNDLLDVSQIESGQVVLSIQPLNLEEIADQAIQDLNHRVQDYDKKVSIEKDIQINLPPVIGDSERIRRIFDNLLDNAYQYNSEEGKIIIRMNQTGENVQVDIHDTGVGIHPHDQESVFERFFRGENSLSLGISGTGLGLSIVKNMVEMHNGKIWMESKGIPGEGSTFSFTIPIYKPEEDINPQAIQDG
jgi:PAS domain S-box-containing protein